MSNENHESDESDALWEVVQNEATRHVRRTTRRCPVDGGYLYQVTNEYLDHVSQVVTSSSAALSFVPTASRSPVGAPERSHSRRRS